jgi:predicted nucleic acid-binding protein
VLDLARDGLLYLDTSALMKLVVDEAETPALREELARWGEGRFVTSALTRVELPRAVARAVPPVVLGDRWRAVGLLLDSMNIIPLVDGIAEAAAELPPPTLRSLDAIHLASALFAYVGERSTVVCGYDRRLQDAAAGHGLLTISPA